MGYKFGKYASFGANTLTPSATSAGLFYGGVAIGTSNTNAGNASLVVGSGNSIASGASLGGSLGNIVAGKNNTLNATNSPTGNIVIGSGNTADSDYAACFGRNNTHSGASYALIAGYDNTVTSNGDASLVVGESCLVSGGYNCVVGFENKVGTSSSVNLVVGEAITVDDGIVGLGAVGVGHSIGSAAAEQSDYSFTSGRGADTRFYGQRTLAGRQFSAVGDAQTSEIILKCQTTSATPVEAVAGHSSNVSGFNIPNDSAGVFKVSIIARNTGTDDDCAAYTLVGALDRNASAGTTALLGSVTKTVIHEDDSNWDINATADTSDGGIQVLCTGAAGKNVNWVCRMEMTEVVG